MYDIYLYGIHNMMLHTHLNVKESKYSFYSEFFVFELNVEKRVK